MKTRSMLAVGIALTMLAIGGRAVANPEFIFDQTNKGDQVSTSTVHDSSFTGDRGSVRSSATGNSVLVAEYPSDHGSLPSKATVTQHNDVSTQTATMTFLGNKVNGADYSVGSSATGNSVAGFVNPLR